MPCENVAGHQFYNKGTKKGPDFGANTKKAGVTPLPSQKKLTVK